MTALEEAAKAVVESANQHGTSNGPVARFAMLAMERIEIQAAIITRLGRRVAELEEFVGAPMP